MAGIPRRPPRRAQNQLSVSWEFFITTVCECITEEVELSKNNHDSKSLDSKHRCLLSSCLNALMTISIWRAVIRSGRLVIYCDQQALDFFGLDLLFFFAHCLADALENSDVSLENTSSIQAFASM